MPLLMVGCCGFLDHIQAKWINPSQHIAVESFFFFCLVDPATVRSALTLFDLCFGLEFLVLASETNKMPNVTIYYTEAGPGRARVVLLGPGPFISSAFISEVNFRKHLGWGDLRPDLVLYGPAVRKVLVSCGKREGMTKLFGFIFSFPLQPFEILKNVDTESSPVFFCFSSFYTIL